MYNGIGLTTPRGSGTNGYVQRNLSFIKIGKNRIEVENDDAELKLEKLLAKKGNEEILEHERKRQIEIECLTFEDELLQQGYDDLEVEERVNAHRKELNEKCKDVTSKYFKNSAFRKHCMKETHVMAEANIAKNDAFRTAMKIHNRETDEPKDNDVEDEKLSTAPEENRKDHFNSDLDGSQVEETETFVNGRKSDGKRKRKSSKKSRVKDEQFSEDDSNDDTKKDRKRKKSSNHKKKKSKHRKRDNENESENESDLEEKEEKSRKEKVESSKKRMGDRRDSIKDDDYDDDDKSLSKRESSRKHHSYSKDQSSSTKNETRRSGKTSEKRSRRHKRDRRHRSSSSDYSHSSINHSPPSNKSRLSPTRSTQTTIQSNQNTCSTSQNRHSEQQQKEQQESRHGNGSSNSNGSSSVSKPPPKVVTASATTPTSSSLETLSTSYSNSSTKHLNNTSCSNSHSLKVTNTSSDTHKSSSRSSSKRSARERRDQNCPNKLRERSKEPQLPYRSDQSLVSPLPHILVCGVVIYGEDYTRVPPPHVYETNIPDWTEDFFWDEKYRKRYEHKKRKERKKQRRKEDGMRKIDIPEFQNRILDKPLIQNLDKQSKFEADSKVEKLQTDQNTCSVELHTFITSPLSEKTKNLQIDNKTSPRLLAQKTSPPIRTQTTSPPVVKSGRSSPHFMERRRITSARKKPIPYPREEIVFTDSESSCGSDH